MVSANDIVCFSPVQPNNVMREAATGVAKLFDFGIAYAPGHSARETSPSELQYTLAGAPSYYSPEMLAMSLQLEARAAGCDHTIAVVEGWGLWERGWERAAAVDIWALGVLYVAMLTGKATEMLHH